MLEYFRRLKRHRGTRTGLLLALTAVPSLFVAVPAQAQLVRGTLSGSVSDQQSRLIQNVGVKITNLDTGITTTTRTNDAGVYSIGAVEPGFYSVEFTAKGFKSVTFDRVDLPSSQQRTVNANMALESFAQVVNVPVELPGENLSKSDATVQMTLSGKQLEEIPFITTNLVPDGSRNAAKQALMAPGVARVNGQNQFSANGQRSRNSQNMIDGVDNNFISITFPAVLVPPEAIREFSVQTATFSAEFGKHTGAQVNVITKNGTNAFHGEAWEFYRGNALEPLSLVNRIAGFVDCGPLLVKIKCSPRLVDNQFGADFGGPILKNKTFFFGLIQANLQRQAPTAQTPITIPTPAGYAALQTVPLRSVPTVQSAASRQAVLDALNFLPSVYPTINRFDSLTTQTVGGIPVEMGTFTPVIPKNSNLWYSAFRIDHNPTSNDRLSYRFHIDNRKNPLSGGNFVAGERWAADNQSRAQNHAFSYIKTINANFINEARLAYTRIEPDNVERDPVSSTIQIGGTSGSLFKIGGLASFPQQLWEQGYQFQNVGTYIYGKHSMKFGIDLTRITLFNNSATNSKGTWSFNTLDDFLNNTNANLAQLVAAPSSYKFNQLKQGYFFQDDIKITRSFTANLGLRYETESVPLGNFGMTEATIQTAITHGATQAQVDILRGIPGPGLRDTNNWGPRLGFAFSPEFDHGFMGTILGNGRSSIRGGLGVIYDGLFYQLLGNPATNYPRNDPQTNIAMTDQFPNLIAKTATPSLPISSTLFVNFPSDVQNPTTNYWSLSVQRQIRSHYVLEVGYIGNRSYHTLRQSQVNPGILSNAKAAAVIAGCTSTTLPGCQDPAGFPTSPLTSTGAASTASRLNPNIGSRTSLATDGEASYNAGYVQFSGRYSHGLQFGANYTWSANLSDSEEVFNDSSDPTGIFPSSPSVPQNYLDRHAEWARSAFDRPNRLTFHYSYEIPWFSDSPDMLRFVFARWQLSGFTELQSGAPFTIVIGVDALGTGTASSARPDLNPGGILLMDPSTGNLRTFTIPINGTGIVTAPHVTAPSGTITFLANSMPIGGTLGRNTFRGPGYSNTNMSLMKQFNLSQDKRLEVRGDFINVFNHDNFQNPIAKMSDVNFGKQNATPLTDARQVLLGVKLRF